METELISTLILNTPNTDHPIILFDGECNLCNSSVQFVIKHDAKAVFKFASLQSNFGKSVLRRFGFPTDKADTFLLLKDDTLFQKSTAALIVTKQLGVFFKLFSIFRSVPVGIRDLLYSYIAKNRYRWFGKSRSCMVPNPKLLNRFIY